jgi:hypothetical protein
MHVFTFLRRTFPTVYPAIEVMLFLLLFAFLIIGVGLFFVR